MFENAMNVIKELEKQAENSKVDTRFEKNKLYDYLGKGLVNELKKHNVFVAGGLITSLFTGKKINDVDVYFRTEEDILSFVENNFDTHITSHTKKATSFIFKGKKYTGEPIDITVQAIHFKYFNSPQEIFDTFDFTHVMGAYDFKTEEFVLHRDFLKHNAQKILKFNKNTAFPLISLVRTNKYQDRGYSVSKSELMRIVMTCMNLDINTYDELKDQLAGMYGEALDNMFTDLDDSEFSLDKAIDHLQDLVLREDYFKDPKQVEFSSVEDLLDLISKQPFKYFIVDGDEYRIRGNGMFTHNYQEIPEDAIRVDVADIFNNMRLYKFVRKEDEKLVSFYRSSFEYKVGEIAETSNPEGLFFNTRQNITKSTYYRHDNKVLIEVAVDGNDLIDVDERNIQVKKCEVVREVPEEEWKHLI